VFALAAASFFFSPAFGCRASFFESFAAPLEARAPV
jgi:hypothetical protein